jgi:hypothetical protein
MKSLLLALALAVSAFQALAQPAALVEGVQMPAWLERAGKRTPLAPGMELRAGDAIISGSGARVLLKLGEGSVVKLGENGTLRLTELAPARELFKAAMQVIEGAFRFTTDIAAKARKREVNVRVGQVSAGIRGTDFWGRSRDDRQIVCLIEGAIEVGAVGEPAVTMDKPLQFYRREKGQTQPVGFVAADQIAQWSRETEIEQGKGAARVGGKFSVQLVAAESQGAARKVYEQVRAAGYAAVLAPRKEGDKTVYRVLIRNLPSRAEAQGLADRLKGNFGVDDPKI